MNNIEKTDEEEETTIEKVEMIKEKEKMSDDHENGVEEKRR